LKNLFKLHYDLFIVLHIEEIRKISRHWLTTQLAYLQVCLGCISMFFSSKEINEIKSWREKREKERETNKENYVMLFSFSQKK